MAKQKKLSSKGRTDLGTDLTDYDLTFIPNPTSGPFTCEAGYETIYNLDFFSDKLFKQSRKEFQKLVLQEISKKSYEKIEKAIASFVSSPKNSIELFPLKESIFLAFPHVIDQHLSNSYYSKDDIQHLRPDQVEVFNKKEFSLTDSQKILIDDILSYKKSATKITNKYLTQYAKYCKQQDGEADLINEYDDILVFRGFNNKFYYNSNNQYPDAISLYTHSTEKEHFFERNLLTSYTICPYVAEKFMVAFKSRRKMLLKGYIGCVSDRMLSSFIVSDKFVDGQYEILCTPGNHLLFIFERMNDEHFAHYVISTDGNPVSIQ